jgi:hypothetical protein
MRVGESRSISAEASPCQESVVFMLTAYSLTLQIVSEMMGVALDSGIRP